VLHRALDPARRITSDEDSPFRGLLPFTERHAGLFFGREPEIGAVVERCRLQPVLAIVGPTGSGKSSFVQAGLVPRLREQGPWVVLQLRPTSRPFHSLASRLQRIDRDTTSDPLADGNIQPARTSGDVKRLAEWLRGAPGRLALELRSVAEERGCAVLLVVDQLEEIFTLTSDESIRWRFIKAICAAADDPLEPIRVVFTIRDDFLGRLAISSEVQQALTQVTVVQSLGPAALRDILLGPVESLGYSYEDPALIDEMVAAASGELASLPLLQFSAQTLWEQRDREDKLLLRSVYESMGGVAGALATHADGVLDGLSDGERVVARELLLRMVSASRTRKLISRGQALAGLDEHDGEERAAQVLAKLTASRLISVTRPRDKTEDSAMLELAHESLIHTWRTLARWVDDSQDELSFLADVGQSAELWHKRGCRQEELWQGEALHDALRMLRRCVSPAPAAVQRFLDEANVKETRSIQRRRLLMIGTFAVLLAAVAVFAFQVRQADRQHAIADQLRQLADQRHAEGLCEGARAAMKQNSLLEARAKLRLALEIENSSAARVLWWQLENEPVLWSRRLGAMIYAVAVSPDGNHIAVASQDHTVQLLDAATRQSLRVLRGHDDQVFAVRFSPNGKQIASGGWDGNVRLWQRDSGTVDHVLRGHRGGVRAVAFSPDGALLASGSMDGSVRIWDRVTGQPKAKLSGHVSAVFCLAFSPDGHHLASGSRNGTIRIWDPKSGHSKQVLRDLRGEARAVVFSPDSKLLASGGGQRIHLWDSQNGKHKAVIEGHRGAIMGLDISHDGNRLASASSDKTVRLWSLPSGKPLRVFEDHSDEVYSIVFAPGSERLIAAGKDRVVRLWDLRVAPKPRLVGGHGSAVYDASFSRDGNQIASAGRDGTIRLWDTMSGRQKRIVRGHSGGVRRARFSPDGNWLASSGIDASLRLWRLPSATQQSSIAARTHSIAFLSNSSALAWGGSGGLRLWDIGRGQNNELSGHGAEHGLSISADDAQIATGDNDGKVWIWDRLSGKLLRELDGHDDEIWNVAFGPHGKQLLSGSLDGRVLLWDLDTGKSRLLTQFSGRAYDPAFDPEGKHAAASGSETEARLIDLTSGKVRLLRGHRAEVNSLTFSPNGKHILTSSDDGTIRLWDVDRAAPHWQTRALLPSSPHLLTHRGWSELAGGKPQTSRALAHPRLRAALEEGAALSSAHLPKGLLCAYSDEGHLQLWRLADDRRLWERRVRSPRQLVASPDGCLLRTEEKALLLTRQGKRIELKTKGRPRALGLIGRSILIATTSSIYVFDLRGERISKQPAARGIVALGPAGGAVALGFRDGSIQLQALDPTSSTPALRLKRTPFSEPTRIVDGPGETILVGFANGLVGIWDRSRGTRLAATQIHGAVLHLLLQDSQMIVTSELGEHLVWDLKPLVQDYCQLLRRVWSKIGVSWEQGRLVRRAPPTGHRCLPAALRDAMNAPD